MTPKHKLKYYVTLKRKDNQQHTIDVAVSDSPTGPFKPARKDGTPLITDDTIRFIPLTQEGSGRIKY